MTPRTKVLHLIKTLALGGAETNLLNLIGAFDETLVESHVGYSYGGEIEPRFRVAGIRLFKYAERSHKVKSPHSLLIVWRLARYIRTHRIDIVHTHNFNAHIWGLLAAKLAGAKVVEHVHDFRYTSRTELARRHGWMSHYRFIKYFRRRSDRVVILTEDNRHHLVANDLSEPERIVKIPNGITQADYPRGPSALRKELGLEASTTVVLTSARMDPTKNVDLVLRVAGRVVARASDTCFVIAGTGPLLDTLKARSVELGVEKVVRFIGFREDMYALLAEADVYLLPSFLELHSIAILEALKMAVPVVVSRGVGCNDEFIDDGRNGYLCDPFTDEPWVNALVALTSDRELRRRVGEAGRRTCRDQFDIVTTARRFEALYAQMT